MIRVSVMANDSLVVDAIASLLVQEITLNVLQLTYCLSRNMSEYIRDHRCVVIMIDDGELDPGSLPVPYSDRNDGPLLLIKASLKTINLHIYQSHPLANPPIEQVTKLVRDFSRTYLRKINDEEAATWAI